MNTQSNASAPALAHTVTAEQWADRLVNAMFAGRTGHGATPGVTYMQMRPPALRDVASESFAAGASFANSTLTGILTKDNARLTAQNAALVATMGHINTKCYTLAESTVSLAKTLSWVETLVKDAKLQLDSKGPLAQDIAEAKSVLRKARDAR